MKIGIDASRGFLKKRTGVEEYSYQLIRALIRIDSKNQYVLYLNGKENLEVANTLDLPNNFKIKSIPFPRLWVHIRLCLAAWKDKLDVLFISSQAMPIFYQGRVVVTLHGLEYEYYPASYSVWRRFYLRFTTKFSLKHADKIIAVSENTKKDLVDMYRGDVNRIKVVYHGYNSLDNVVAIGQGQNNDQYILYIGRLETRKNTLGLIQAFELLKKDGFQGHLVLVGKPGFGYDEIRVKILESKYKNAIIEKGFVDENEKWELLKNAKVFALPSFYEGFGMPLLEAMAARVPIACSNASSLPEIGGNACLYFDPEKPKNIKEKIKAILDNEDLRRELIQKGKERIKNFSWEKCARETMLILEEVKK